MVATPTRFRSSAAARLARASRSVVPLSLEQGPIGDVLEVGRLDLQHDVLQGRVVSEVRGDQRVAGGSHVAGAAAEVEQQIGETETRAEHRLGDRAPPLRGHRLEPGTGHIAVDGREIGAALPSRTPPRPPGRWPRTAGSRDCFGAQDPPPRPGSAAGSAVPDRTAPRAASTESLTRLSAAVSRPVRRRGHAGTPLTEGVPTHPASQSSRRARRSRGQLTRSHPASRAPGSPASGSAPR